ncbi:MAG TPA: AAA family ATPase, partial [Candidatus Eremiobacteraceae bacterium]|nr:AAA family ATPase [Candidatus Eremiobacteraceae bacterium]
ADPAVLDLLLQILDEGRLTDAQSRRVDFRNTLIILTAHVPGGSEAAALRDILQPELLNRLDDAVMFRVLAAPDIRRITELAIQPLIAAAAEQGVELRVSDAALDALAAEATDPRQGARMVRRVVERRLRSPLAAAVLGAKPRERAVVLADVDANGVVELRMGDSFRA